jgi:hydroxyethylthiazole kinase-like uncharacterized protein yjeF
VTRLIPPGAPVLTAAGMRAAEQALFDHGTPQDALMERAGLAVAREARRLAGSRPILALAGRGNNGGDAYAAARHLAEWGRDVAVAALGEPKEGAAARMAEQWTGATMPFDEAEARPFVIDGLFGTGVTRPLDPAVAAKLADLAADAFTLAIDLPSGVPTDADGTFRTPYAADVTLALGALKPAHLADPGCGHVVLADIGVPVPSDWTSIAPPSLSAPPYDAHKFSRGMVAVVAGAMPGAAELAAAAALRGGAGYVLLIGDDASSSPPHAIVRRTGEVAATLEDDRIAAVLIGPGLGRDERARERLTAALNSPHPLVLDGDALMLLGSEAARVLATRIAPVWLTPHAGEFDRMFPPGPSAIDRTLAAARATAATVVRKGPCTVIADPDGRAVIAAGATSWLSTAGTGDVLAGLLAGRVAAGDPRPAATAVWLHARAARRAGPAFVADDLLGRIAPAISETISA